MTATPLDIGATTERIIGACNEARRALEPGLVESADEECVCHELRLAGVRFERQRPLRVEYKGLHLESAHRLDFIVEKHAIVEFEAQLDLLVNFNVPILRRGVQRVVHNLPSTSANSARSASLG